MEKRTNLLTDVHPAIWLSIASMLIAAALFMQAVFPRYQFYVLEDGQAMIIYDRWAGRFQRTNYDANGEPTLTRVLTPF